MRKQGHLLVTNHIMMEQKGWEKACILLGCVLPDFWIPSLMKGHKRDKNWDKIKEQMEKLERKGSWNMRSCIKLGIILHYVEDYFTYAHSRAYEGGLYAHCMYEKKQYQEFKEHLSVEKQVIEQVGAFYKYYVNSIADWMEEQFEEYDGMPHCVETDYLIMKRAVNVTWWYFEREFNINEHIMENAAPDVVTIHQEAHSPLA